MATKAPPRRVSYTPDYQALIQQDPGFAALSQQLQAQDTTNAAQRQAATEQALIQFGMIPDFQAVAAQLGLSPQALQMLQSDIDPNAAALARANTSAGLSTEAGLQQNQDQAVRALRNNLAARGGLSSGEDAYRTNLQDQAYAKAQSDALSQLLAAVNGYQQQYLTSQQQADAQRQAGLQSALQFESGLPQNQGFTLRYDARHGVYRDASGNTYVPHRNHDGTWRLTSTATGAVYTLGADGSLTTATGHQVAGPSAGGIPTHPGDGHNPGGGTQFGQPTPGPIDMQPPYQSPVVPGQPGGVPGPVPGGPQTSFGPPSPGSPWQAPGGMFGHPGGSPWQAGGFGHPAAGSPWQAGGAPAFGHPGPVTPHPGSSPGNPIPPWMPGGGFSPPPHGGPVPIPPGPTPLAGPHPWPFAGGIIGNQAGGGQMVGPQPVPFSGVPPLPKPVI